MENNMEKKQSAVKAGRGSRALSSDEAMAAILSYLGFLVLIPLFIIKKRNRFIEFHLRQGLAMFAIEIALWLISAVMAFMVFASAWIFWPLLQIINIAGFVVFVIAIIAIVKAYSGKEWEIPLVYEIIAKKISLPKA